MTFLINTNEHKRVKKIFEKEAFPFSLDGFDFLLYTNSGVIPGERKRIPQDLISSVEDGRLNREILAMREVSEIYFVLLEGTFGYNHRTGLLRMGRRLVNWKEKGIRNLLRTIQYCEGAYIEYSRDTKHSVEVVASLQEYFDAKRHLSLKHRPRLQSAWYFPLKTERVIYFYQGLPGIGSITAKAIYEKFPNPLSLFQASIDEICEASRIGKSMATKIYNFLRGIE